MRTIAGMSGFVAFRMVRLILIADCGLKNHMISDSELPIPDLADFSIRNPKSAIRNPQFTEIRVDLLAGCLPYRCLHEPGDVQCRLGLVQPLDARHRLRMLGYEHRAAVL